MAECNLQDRLENDSEYRGSIDCFTPQMQKLDSNIAEEVLQAASSFCDKSYGNKEVEKALASSCCTFEDFKALLSSTARENYLEELATKASSITARHFGNSACIFTPLYIANFCDNYCVYCGFNRYNKIKRACLNQEQIDSEMQVIAKSGIEEILILTGESPTKSPQEYIGMACKLAKKYFRTVALEVYPMNQDDYQYLHECGADFVTVFQETYDREQYEKLHLAGNKRVWRYRFDTQERAILGGMRGVAFAPLFGLSNPIFDAIAAAMHATLLQKKYPWIEISLSCPRLRQIHGEGDRNYIHSVLKKANIVDQRLLCQILSAWRIFMPFAGITVSSREDATFRNGILKIAATKISAGVSTGVGDHEQKYTHKIKTQENDNTGEEQFIIQDDRSLPAMCHDIKELGFQSVLNDYVSGQ